MRTDLATLIGSRICHDLISPIGAIGNGVELLELTNPTGVSSPEMDLISESVDNANAKIRFFRIAFGTPSSKHFIGRQEVMSVLAASARGGRLSYFWQVEGDQTRVDVQIAFLLLQCFEAALPFGGDVHIELKGTSWMLRANGQRRAIATDLWDSLTNPDLAVKHTPAQVQFALLPSILAEAGKTLQITIEDDAICAEF